MNENEYFNDDDVLGDFLVEEPPDIDFILMPKLEIDEERIIDDYYKQIKNCRNKEQVKEVLKSLYSYASDIAVLQNDVRDLQNRAKELEFCINMIQQKL